MEIVYTRFLGRNSTRSFLFYECYVVHATTFTIEWRNVVTKKNEQHLLNRCMMALQQVGVRVTTERGNVTCVFPPDPNDEHGAPDGEEKTYSTKDFTLLVTRTFLDLTERGVINAEGNAV